VDSLHQHRPRTTEDRNNCLRRPSGPCRGFVQCLKVSGDQHHDVGIVPRDGAGYLPVSTGHLDVADANLQMALAVVAASDEARIQRMPMAAAAVAGLAAVALRSCRPNFSV